MVNQCGCDEGHNLMTSDRAASGRTAAKRSISRTMFN